MVAEAVGRFGRIDVLFHNAVSVPMVNKHDRRITELPEETWHAIVGLVLTGTFLTAKYVAQKMLVQRSGSIILTATVDALVGQAGLDAYTAAKGGVVAMTRSMAAGLSPEGVRVNAICPGFVKTPHQSVFLDDARERVAIEVAASDGHHGPRGGRRFRRLPRLRRSALDDRRHPCGRQRLHRLQGQYRPRGGVQALTLWIACPANWLPKLAKNCVGELARGGIDQPAAELGDLAADVGLDRVGQHRGVRPSSGSETSAPPLAKPAMPPLPSPVIV